MSDLARHLGCMIEDINEYVGATNQLDFYQSLWIHKKGRRRHDEFRVVYKSQSLFLTRAHKLIADSLCACTDFPDYVQGYVPGRSIVTNARQHLAAQFILHADIKSFFDSIELKQVIEAFQSLGCNDKVANALGKLCTLNGFLPQGVHSSPVLANLVCHKTIDVELQTLARAHQCRYTRYADDITFSGARLPPSSRIKSLLEKHGFELRDGACRIQKRGRNQFVTGLSVFDEMRPHVPRTMKRKLRLVLHFMSRFGVEGHCSRGLKDEYLEIRRMKGLISYIYSVEPEKAAQFEAQLKRILEDEQARTHRME